MKCPVCLESFNSEKKTVSTQCGHLIHDECIQKWLDQGTNTCPKCRQKITNRHEIYQRVLTTKLLEDKDLEGCTHSIHLPGQ